MADLSKELSKELSKDFAYCEDTISRKAAIDALDKRFDSIPMEQTTEILQLRKDLRKLPSAQPKERTEERAETHACDCISRQAAIDAQEAYMADHPLDGYEDGLALIDILRNLPSVQPERKNGEWLRYGEDGYPNNEDTVFWQCDQCLEQYTGRAKKIPNFCPNCGADMRGEQE